VCGEQPRDAVAGVREVRLPARIAAIEQHPGGEGLALDLQIDLVPASGAAGVDLRGHATERVAADARRLAHEAGILARREQQPRARVDVRHEGRALPERPAGARQRQHGHSRADAPLSEGHDAEDRTTRAAE
jgi:hypothetical protein